MNGTIRQEDKPMNLNVSPSPHLRAKQDTKAIMRHMLIALAPACAAGVYRFGYEALIVLLVTTAAAIMAEWALNLLMKRPGTVSDLSAAVTGLLLGMNLPATAPWWMCALGSVFAIGLVKVLFGGLGNNFVNPALAARAFLMVSFPARMTTWINPLNNPLAGAADAVSSATPLALMKQGGAALNPSGGALNDLTQLFFGNTGGTIGEVSALALLIGFIWLLAFGIIEWRIPLIYMATVFVGTALLGGPAGESFYPPLINGAMNLLSGGLMLGAIFMATDYTTSPVTSAGQWIYALGCGALTVVIRLFGGYPEGVSFSILIMNLCVPLIERGVRARAFGEVKRRA
jgi:electron transport complex protein RnfD